MPTTQITYNVTKEYAEELFGLTSEYTLGDLRAAFRRLAVECHPDMATDEVDLIEREAKSRIVNMSYARLKRQFIMNGETSVKPLSEIIMESKESGGESCDDEVFDDILDFLDDIDDTVPDDGSADSQCPAGDEYEKCDSPESNGISNKPVAVDSCNYSLPPFLRRRYRRSTAETEDTGSRNDGNRKCDTGDGTNLATINASVGTTRPDIEDEIDRIMANILRNAGCI